VFLARIRTNIGIAVAARVAPDTLVRLDSLVPHAPDDPLALLLEFDAADLQRRTLALWQEAAASGAEPLTERDVEFEPPVAHCGKVVCVALNYAAHAKEGDFTPPKEPIIFFKPPTSLIGHNQPVVCPARSERLDYEVELAVVIGRRARNVDPARWQEVVAGYTIFNDVTARDLQLSAIAANSPWDRSKGFDTFAPLGPYLVTPDEIDDPHALDLEIRIGDAVLQQSNTRHMIFPLPQLLADITDGMTLEPGDVIGTGTPDGIGPAEDGDVMEATVEGLGTLRSPVVFAAAAEPSPIVA
jgi:5-oxopent-3-ene-1,2,5-tricarboxylate decarboxylase/2-hydroxyhepta-2,4-diene-1,7-dioate isomerase